MEIEDSEVPLSILYVSLKTKSNPPKKPLNLI